MRASPAAASLTACLSVEPTSLSCFLPSLSANLNSDLARRFTVQLDRGGLTCHQRLVAVADERTPCPAGSLHRLLFASTLKMFPSRHSASRDGSLVYWLNRGVCGNRENLLGHGGQKNGLVLHARASSFAERLHAKVVQAHADADVQYICNHGRRRSIMRGYIRDECREWDYPHSFVNPK